MGTSVGEPVGSARDVNAVERARFGLVAVRGRDVRRRSEALGPVPARHGGEDDPRYPSPRLLRRGVGFVVDVLVHLGVSAGIGVAVYESGASMGFVVLGVLLGYLGASVLHRVVVQAVCTTTLGKALAGLRLVRDDTGGRPSVWSLVKAWVFGLGVGLANIVAS